MVSFPISSGVSFLSCFLFLKSHGVAYRSTFVCMQPLRRRRKKESSSGADSSSSGGSILGTRYSFINEGGHDHSHDTRQRSSESTNSSTTSSSPAVNLISSAHREEAKKRDKSHSISLPSQITKNLRAFHKRARTSEASNTGLFGSAATTGDSMSTSTRGRPRSPKGTTPSVKSSTSLGESRSRHIDTAAAADAQRGRSPTRSEQQCSQQEGSTGYVTSQKDQPQQPALRSSRDRPRVAGRRDKRGADSGDSVN